MFRKTLLVAVLVITLPLTGFTEGLYHVRKYEIDKQMIKNLKKQEDSYSKYFEELGIKAGDIVQISNSFAVNVCDFNKSILSSENEVVCVYSGKFRKDLTLK